MSPRLPTSAVRTALRTIQALALAPPVPIGVQRLVADVAGRLPVQAGRAEATSGELGGVRGEWIVPPGVVGGETLLYLHGGGYAIGSPQSHRPMVARLAARTQARAFVPAYRLAPEHPFPAALDDALAAYEALLDSGVDAGSIVVAGDSAGGGLALALAMVLRDGGRPQPRALALICPWLDLAQDLGRGRAAVGRDPLLTPTALTKWARDYLRGADPHDPRVSPLLGDLADLPPIVLHTASDDVLHPDSVELLRRAGEAGVPVEYRHFDDLWHGFHVHVGVLAAADEAVDALGDALVAPVLESRARLRVGIVGAGMSGICMATRLREAGYDNIVILEKGQEVGGTWRENRYPGLTCDVPSRFYSYSFAPNPSWSRMMAPGPEILEYFKSTTDKLDLRRHIRFGSEVTDAQWEGGRWHLKTADGYEDQVDVLVTATGFLHHPQTPEIDGLDSFAGAAFHSAQWDSSVSLEGKRVAVVGTGSTGAQITTALSTVAGRLSVFQRTPQWVLPVPNRTYSAASKFVFSRAPWLNRMAQSGYRALLERTLGEAVAHAGWQRTVMSTACRLNLRYGIRDERLREKLTPDYAPLCKRLVISSGLYPALQRDNVEVVTDAIDHVEERGIVTRDGRLHEVDVLVLATGFDAHAYMRPMRIVGEGELTLDEAWSKGPRAYQTVAMPGFPNFFMVVGPHSPVGNQSIIGVAETQTNYIMQWVNQLAPGGVTVSPKQEATATFNETMRAAMPHTIAASGCSSWYLGADGVPEIWPWTPGKHREMLSEAIADDFDIVSTPSVATPSVVADVSN